MTSPHIHDHMHEWQPYPQIQALEKPILNSLQPKPPYLLYNELQKCGTLFLIHVTNGLHYIHHQGHSW